jgi:uncharacterized membrane protein HdeD (DUF308 family)
MNASTSLSPTANISHGWSIALSIFMILAGIIAIAIPPIAGLAVTVIVGWLLVISGVFHIIYAWHSRSRGALVWEIFLGLVYMAVGIFLLVHPVAGLASLTLALAAYLLAESVLEIILAIRIRSRRHRGWGWILFDGIITLILGLMIWLSWPHGSPWIIGTLIGISMLFSGTSRLMVSLSAKKAANPAI